MKIRLAHKQVQSTILAPSMQQSIEILQLPVQELSAAIDQELQNNPLLEIAQEQPSPSSSSETNDHIDQIINQDLMRQTDSSYLPAYDLDNDERSETAQIARGVSLEEHLSRQLQLEVTNPVDLRIGEMIIGNLNDAGYLRAGCEEMAQLLGIQNVQRVESVLALVKTFEPVGIACFNLKECLLTQIDRKYNGKNTLLHTIVNEHLESLSRKKHQEIARSLKISIEHVKDAAAAIAKLEPYPARSYRPVDTNIYIKPDINIVKDDNDQYQVQINKEHVPQLRVSAVYQKMLTQPNCTEEEKLFIREKMKNAILFIKSIEQRHHTLKEIANYICRHQKDFWEEGHMALKPMTLKDIAQTINRNESTVCRATSNKFMDTPQGVYPMKFFFSQAVNETTDSNVSSTSIKEEIKTIIEEENKNNPLSDQDIVRLFDRRGLNLARRTVNKYRQAMRILPSHLRKS